MEVKRQVGILGARSFVGVCLLNLLSSNEYQITAFSRQKIEQPFYSVNWQQLLAGSTQYFKKNQAIPLWICAAPIWVLPDYFDLLEASGAERIVLLSSTSRFTKTGSSDLAEQEIAQRLIDSEKAVQNWASEKGVDWVILRPTLIYGLGRDKNISEIIRFIRRFGFFPLFGKAEGLRQPVHCNDVANACLLALKAQHVDNRVYNISGAETLTYKEMIKRVFIALDMSPCFFTIPLPVFKLAVLCLHIFPRYKHWSVAMVERMNRDLVFNHDEARRDLAYKPKAFVLSEQDVLVK